MLYQGLGKEPRVTARAAPSRGNAEAGVYEHLRDDIVRGQLGPGMRLTEAEVAQWLGVSRTPAREATQRLLAEGLLVRAGGGARPRVAVAPLSGEAAVELYAAAGALEGVAARATAVLEAALRATLAAELRSLDAAFHRTAGARPLDFDRLFSLHAAFHRRLTDACAGPRTAALLALVRVQLERYEWAYAPLLAPEFGPTFIEHAAIIRAVRGGSAGAVERAVRANWFNGATRLRRAIDEAGGDPRVYAFPHPPGAG